MCAFLSQVFQSRPTPACFEEGWIKTRAESAAERAECWEELPFQKHSHCLQASWVFAMRLGTVGRSVGGLCCSLSVVAELRGPSLQLQDSGSTRGGVICMWGGIFQLQESQQLIVRNSSGEAGIDL